MSARRLFAVSLAALLPACLSLGSTDESPKPDGGGTGGSSVKGGGGFPYEGGAGTGASGGTSSGGGSGGVAGQGASGGTTPNGGTGGCSPTSCAAQGTQCGTIDDGCGTPIDCGACPTGQACNNSAQCQGIDGTWTALYSECDGVQDPPDPTMTIEWTVAPGVLKVVISDTDCTITDYGTINYTSTTFSLSFGSRTCSTDGCQVGQAGAVCNPGTTSNPPVVNGSYTLTDAQHLVIQYPGGPGTGCASGQTQTVHFSR